MENDVVLSAFRTLFHNNTKDEDILKIGIEIPIPHFDEDIVIRLLKLGNLILQKEPILVHACSPIIVVGDLHGSLHDLLRIFANNGISDDCNYLFLGDYVDRGPFSTEVMLLLISLKISYPENITLLRGNHECVDICSSYGFKQEVLSQYSETVFEMFLTFFSNLPLSAIIDNRIFCVHGGISPNIKHYGQIEANYQKPIVDFNIDPLLKNLVWSDPTNSDVMYMESDRAGCCVYGYKAVQVFLKECGLEMMLRAHQCVQNGVHWNKDLFATVFSSSCYSPPKISYNKSGIIRIFSTTVMKNIRYEPLPKMPRGSATFFTISTPSLKTKRHRNLSFMLNTSGSSSFIHGFRSVPPLFKTGHTSNSANGASNGAKQMNSTSPSKQLLFISPSSSMPPIEVATFQSKMLNEKLISDYKCENGINNNVFNINNTNANIINNTNDNENNKDSNDNNNGDCYNSNDSSCSNGSGNGNDGNIESSISGFYRKGNAKRRGRLLHSSSFQKTFPIYPPKPPKRSFIEDNTTNNTSNNITNNTTNNNANNANSDVNTNRNSNEDSNSKDNSNCKKNLYMNMNKNTNASISKSKSDSGGTICNSLDSLLENQLEEGGKCGIINGGCGIETVQEDSEVLDFSKLIPTCDKKAVIA